MNKKKRKKRKEEKREGLERSYQGRKHEANKVGGLLNSTNAIIYDMLLRALTPSKLRTRLLSDWKERLMLLAPNVPHLSET